MHPTLASFFAEEALAWDGRSFDGAPFGKTGGRVETRVASPAESGWVGILDAGDCALFVSETPPHRVVLEDRQTCVVERLSELEPMLLPKLKRVETIAKRAHALMKHETPESDREALELLRPAVRAIALCYVDHDTWPAFHDKKVYAHARNLYGVCLSRLGRDEEAEAMFELASERDPAACRNLADRFLEQGRDNALRALHEAQRGIFERETLAYLTAARAIAAGRAGREDEFAQMKEELKSLPRDEVLKTLLAEHPEGAALAGQG